MAARRIEHQLHVHHRLAEMAGDAGDHRVAHAHVEQQRAKDVAILIDQPLAVAKEVPFTLETRVEPVHHLGDERRHAGVVDLEIGPIYAQLFPAFTAPLVPAAPTRRALAPPPAPKTGTTS